MKKAYQSRTQRSNDLFKNPSTKSNNFKTKSNNDNQAAITKHKTHKNTIGNTMKKEKTKPKLQNPLKNIQNKQNNLLLSNNYVKLKNKPTVQLRKITKSTSQIIKKENSNFNEKKISKIIVNLNLKEQNQNKLIRGNSSYSRTAVSTGNGNVTDNAINSKRNETILKQLIDTINIKEIDKVSKVDLLQNNIFLIKIYSFLKNLTSDDYQVLNLENNSEIKQQFMELANRIDFLNNNKPVNYNINIDLFENNYSNENNNILQESNNRKLVYKNFFDFFQKTLDDIIKLSNELSKKKIKENHKKEDVDSINSKNEFIKNLTKENNSNSEIFGKLSIKDNIIEGENNIYFGMDESNGISSIDNEYYQNILKNSFKDKNAELSKSRITSRNKKMNQNSSSSSSTIINNNDSSDSEIIENFSISKNNSICLNNKNIKQDFKKQISIPLLKTNILLNQNNKKQKICLTQPNQINNDKNINNYNNNTNKVQIITKNQGNILNKLIIKEKIINPIKEDNNKCYIF